MVSLTLWPFAPWHAAHTVAALALPASISAACANGATARATDNPSTFFMGLLLCTRTQGYTSNPARTMPPSFLFLSAMQHSPREFNEREAPMTLLRTLAPFLAAAVALAAGPAQAEMKNQWVEYSQGSTKLKAYLAYDDKVTGRRPAVLMIHAREGMTPKTLSLAEIWANLGYVTFAADIFGYGEGVLPKDVPEMQAQIAIYDKDRALMRARTQAAFDVLVRNPMVDPSRIALIGYCFGGGVGIEFASTGAPLAANVSIHGSFRDRAPGWAANAKGMFLILHGAEDAGFPLTTVNRLIEELRSAKLPFQYEVYSGTGHGFSTPKNKAEERANAQSIGATARTLKELFGI